MRNCLCKKCTLIAVIVLLVMNIPTAYCQEDGKNLLKNGDFEILDVNGLPEEWIADAYRMEPGFSFYGIVSGMESESSAAMIQNSEKNDARFAQKVTVEPNSLYRVSGYIYAEGITEGLGANISIEGLYAFSESVYDSDGEWRYIEYYGETGPEQNSLTVFARVGGYSGESKGKAAFDNLALVKVDSLPAGVYADLWYMEDDPEEFGDEEWEDEISSDETAAPAWPVLTALGFLYILVLFSAIYILRDDETDNMSGHTHSGRRSWLIVLFLALLVRMVISFCVKGYDVDVACFMSWGETMAREGPTAFYLKTSFCDYPPLYTYILGLNSWLCNLFHANAGLSNVIFRFFPSLCDIAGCWILLHIRGGSFTKSRFYRTIILLIAFNPASIMNSAAWGQMDSVLCVLLLCVAFFALKRKWIASIAIYSVSVLVKPQALMLGILGLVFMCIASVADQKEKKNICWGILTGAALIAAIVLPFGIKQKAGWLVRLYSDTLSSYPYATVNTANLYYILGGNWDKISNTAHIAAPLFFTCACILYGILWYHKHREEKHSFIEPALSGAFAAWFIVCAILRLSWSYAGSGAMAYAFFIIISIAMRKKEIRLLPYLGALLFILLYVFGIKMHERYLFPAFLLLATAWAIHHDRRILYLFALFSFTVFVNEGIVLDNSIRLGSAMGHLNADTVWLADALAILNILGAFYAVYLGNKISNGQQLPALQKLPALFPVKSHGPERNASDYHPDRKLCWTNKDTVLLLSITLAFSAISLTTLGSAKAPQTAWKSSDENERIIFDLGKNYDDIRILYFGQVNRKDFSWASSKDAENWSAETWAQMDQGQCWKWKYVTLSYESDDGAQKRNYYNDAEHVVRFSGRYLRLTANQVGLAINEVIFRDAGGATVLAMISSRENVNRESAFWTDANNLLDEQDSLEPLPSFFSSGIQKETQPSWWNSTYFDEIYHARTGFEFTYGTVPYETTHPPLGKVFISWGIKAFGMTPFGWRFAGALAGIAMLPGMYLLAKQLCKKTYAAAFASLLMAMDCMHLTQTQIATIDSFPVLFIIFAFFFMLRFMQTDLRRCKMKEALIPLMLSGINMGLAIASKWIGIYAGIGLAVLYFWHCARNVSVSRDERTSEINSANFLSSDEPCRSEYKDTAGKVIILCAWCVLFFILIPAAIYFASYIPYMAYNTRINSFSDYIVSVWRCQESMLSYHSTPGLGMDHPFYSPWWEWPVIGKPMYYATEQYIDSEAPLHHSIFCFGNPVIWWGALIALIICIIRWLNQKRYTVDENNRYWHLLNRTFDFRYEFVFIGLLAQYLPWVLVPRGTYIYHYFASVPFLILLLTLCFTGGEDDTDRRAVKIFMLLFLAASLVLFILLFPYASGIPVPVDWLNLGKKILKIWY